MARPSVRTIPETAIFEDPIRIVVENLPPNAPVTAEVYYNQNGVMYSGHAHFYSDPHGTLEPGRQSSVGGTYRGVQQMGLFTSMVAFPSRNVGTRFVLKGPADQILKFEIWIWKGHQSRDELHKNHTGFNLMNTGIKIENTEKFSDPMLLDALVCRGSVRRTYFDAAKVTRTKVAETFNGFPIRGTLFMPKGEGPFPAIVDLFGGIGGCVEFRAALYARHGYAALALAYFSYEGLPWQTGTEFPMTYFDAAIEWLLRQPRIRGDGVGMSGVSLGSQVTLLTATRNAKVKAAACIASNQAMLADPAISGNPLDSISTDMIEYYPPKGNHEVIDGRFWAPQPVQAMRVARPPLSYKHDNPILFLLGSEEGRVAASELADLVIDQLRRSGKTKLYKRVIQGQGHIIEPPYSPMCTESRDGGAPPGHLIDKLPNNIKLGLTTLMNNVTYWGGDRTTHHDSQQEAWKALLNFFEEHLRGRPPGAKL